MQVQRHIKNITSSHLELELPASFINQQVEILIVTLDDAPMPPKRRRSPPAQFAGKVKELGDVMNTVPESDWNLSV
ncbi:hypothetical protein [Candidatus Albibeggiatoa sp. nov. BB20]|uniref:hypothetical protein n=1 Tax=Candidatus Albibeggiatoa sp. nov. BB20 TaxID=3162723 RepID=UPI0033658E97